MRRIALLIILAALPELARATTPLYVSLDPDFPIEGQAFVLSYSWPVRSSLRFGKPTVSGPSFGCGWDVSHPCTVTISQTATPEGNATQFVDRGSFILPGLLQGVYTVDYELTVGSVKTRTTIGAFMVSVPPRCAPGPSAFAQYSSEKSGYELFFAEGMNDSVLSSDTAALVSIEGDHVTVRQSLTLNSNPSGSSCIFGHIDLGAIPPGTYRLTWIYYETLPPDRAPAELGTIMVTRELTFEAQAPKRRTSRR